MASWRVNINVKGRPKHPQKGVKYGDWPKTIKVNGPDDEDGAIAAALNGLSLDEKYVDFAEAVPVET